MEDPTSQPPKIVITIPDHVLPSEMDRFCQDQDQLTVLRSTDVLALVNNRTGKILTLFATVHHIRKRFPEP